MKGALMALRSLPLALLALAGSAVSAQNMNAETYYQRSTALIGKGPLAIFSKGEIRALMEEAKRAGEASRAQRLAAAAAGARPMACPPPGPQSLSSSEFMSRLGAIPPAERSHMTMTEAMSRIAASKYPCPR